MALVAVVVEAPKRESRRRLFVILGARTNNYA